ncbi:protein SRC2 homolog [Quercus suber]|uniref:Protein src2 n=1 Tax=Quercus suber TaxID=58331 RepID=A0AAW0KRC4_QUESU|nr:protein SRC2 homolog [Quercus suber]POF01968.1 protein src2 [Quercus suber]
MVAYSPLEIIIKSATDLENVNHVFKMEVYAVVSICGSDNSNLNFPEQRTPVDTDGHSNPKWNFFAKFNIDTVAAQQNQLTLVIKLKSAGNIHLLEPNGKDDIGEVHVPIKKFVMDSFGNAEVEKHESFPVRTMSGELKGALNFSYKLGKPSYREDQHAVKEPGYCGCSHSGYAARSPYQPYGQPVTPTCPSYGHAAQPPYPSYGHAVQSPYPSYGYAAQPTYPLYGHAAQPPYGQAVTPTYPSYAHTAQSPYPPYGYTAQPLYPPYVHAGPAAQPPYGQAAWPYGQAAPQMQPQQRPNSIFHQLGIGVAVGLITAAAQAGIDALT